MRQPWTSHIFNLDIDPGWAANVMTRAQDTEIRLRHHCKDLSDAQLSYQPAGAWSIKEHIGHLIDLEVIHHHRIKELANFKTELTGADMSNAKTHSANHNDTSLEVLLQEFNKDRTAIIADFNALPEAVLKHAALHPRLKVPMKPVDLLFFVAEHDDHHLASIVEVKVRVLGVGF